MRSRSLAACVLGLTVLCLNVTAHAQENYPNKPVHLIVPFPPGQATDIVARMFADRLTRLWGQQVIVENKPGIPGMVAGQVAVPDGYTITVGTSGMLVVNPSVHRQLPYDTLKDYVFIGGLAITPMLIVVNATLPYQTLPELVAAAKKEPGKFNIGFGGVNNTQHLTGEYFKSVSGTNMVGVTYKGSANAVTDLLGGQVSILVDSLAATQSHIQAGKVRALATSSLQRLPQLPEVPTVAESGYPGFESIGWQGLIVPRGTPMPVVEKISRDVQGILADPHMQALLVEKGLLPDARGAAAWSQFVAAEFAKTREVVKIAKIQPTD